MTNFVDGLVITLLFIAAVVFLGLWILYVFPVKSYKGCYVDSKNRAIPNYAGKLMDVNDCALIARHHKGSVFGIQNYSEGKGGECWWGNDEDLAKAQGVTTTCIDDSEDNKVGQASTNAVYTVW